ncbi:MAG: potassium channel family protein [Betaproteobacteria bacterium]
MSTPIQKMYRYCRGDGSLTIAVGLLILFAFVLYPMVEVGALRRVWLDLTFGLFMALGAAFVFEPRPIVRLFLTALATAVLVSVGEIFFAYSWLFALRAAATTIACVLLGWLLLVRVMRDGRMNVNRIMGAVGSYLLIGVVFAQLYRLLAWDIDGAFAIGGNPANFEAIHNLLSYYSFITLTSTGYGDITPVHPYARSLATLEALSGNLFLTVLVARLVGLEMGWREEQRERRRQDDDHASSTQL